MWTPTGVRRRRSGARRGEARAGTPGRAPRDPPGPEELYLLLFTSGSTGAPKAVRVSHGRLADAGLTMATGAGFSAEPTSCTAPCPCSTATPSTSVVPGHRRRGLPGGAPTVLGVGLPPRRPALRGDVLQLRRPGPGLHPGHSAVARRRRQLPAVRVRDRRLAVGHRGLQEAFRLPHRRRVRDRARVPSR